MYHSEKERTVDLKTITFDAGDPPRLAAFWSEATGRAVKDAKPHFALLAPDEHGIQMLFLKVPEGKAAKNRMHLDFGVPDREAEIARLVGLGATRHDTRNEYNVEWTVMTDPEGNEFCVAQE
jgi:predicted enzyme related to lactoylglutathione lyase